jgi:hypothetical protein
MNRSRMLPEPLSLSLSPVRKQAFFFLFEGKEASFVLGPCVSQGRWSFSCKYRYSRVFLTLELCQTTLRTFCTPKKSVVLLREKRNLCGRWDDPLTQRPGRRHTHAWLDPRPHLGDELGSTSRTSERVELAGACVRIYTYVHAPNVDLVLFRGHDANVVPNVIYPPSSRPR